VTDFAFRKLYICSEAQIVVQQVTTLHSDGLCFREIRERGTKADQPGFELFPPVL
jgi:hypothetical protein